MTGQEFLASLTRGDRRLQPALRSSVALTYAELSERVRVCADALSAYGPRVVATLLDNGADWIVADLACLAMGAVHLPLPLFFTPEQRQAAMSAAGASLLLTPASRHAQASSDMDVSEVTQLGGLAVRLLPFPAIPLPAGTSKITFTSGSTGQPKGVCLGSAQMLDVAHGLADATRGIGIGSHLTALPLPVLLENIAGVYAPLLEGACIHVSPLAEVGLQGSSQFDPGRFHAALTASEANSVIVLPQMLRAYAAWLAATRTPAPPQLRLMAVGGAAVGAPLLEQARRLGLPAYEGYGLSEAASVQTLNLPGADLPGSAGRPLPHARVRIAEDGEIEIAGTPFLGYLGVPSTAGDWWPTGDLGRLDPAGYLHVEGRKKNVLITGFGRNVSPEWVEIELGNQPEIRHAVVYGDGEAELGAVIWPQGMASAPAIDAAIARANQRLPDYARIGRWLQARAEFSVDGGMATANGRPRRSAILQQHPDLFQSVRPFSPV